eukprot:COSAG02_NODE_8949_length_2387_cov_1.855332_2_plen_508_part_00
MAPVVKKKREKSLPVNRTASHCRPARGTAARQPQRESLTTLSIGNAASDVRAAQAMHEEDDRQKQQLAAELAESKQIVEAQHQELASARKDVEQHKANVEKAVAIASGKMAAVHDAHQAQLAGLRSEVESSRVALAQQRKAANQIIADARNAVAQSKKRVDSLTAENVAAQNSAQELQQSLEDRTGEMEDLRAQLRAQSQAHATELAAMTVKCSENQAAADTVTAMKAELQEAAQQAASLKSASDAREEELLQRLADADKEAAAVRTALQDDYRSLEDTCTAAQAAVDEKQALIVELTGERDSQRRSLATLSTEVTRLESSERELRAEIGTMAAAVEESQARIAAEENAKQVEIDQLTKECNATKQLAAEADSLRAQLESECTARAAQEASMAEKHSAELTTLVTNHTSAVNDLRAQLEVKSMQLEGSKEGFASAMAAAEVDKSAQVAALKTEMEALSKQLVASEKATKGQMQEGVAGDLPEHVAQVEAANSLLSAERDALSGEVET